MFVHYAADVPLEIGEQDTPGIPLSLYRFLQLDTSLPHLFHGEQHRQGTAADRTQNVTGALFSRWLGYSLNERRFGGKQYQVSLPFQGATEDQVRSLVQSMFWEQDRALRGAEGALKNHTGELSSDDPRRRTAGSLKKKKGHGGQKGNLTSGEVPSSSKTK